MNEAGRDRTSFNACMRTHTTMTKFVYERASQSTIGMISMIVIVAPDFDQNIGEQSGQGIVPALLRFDVILGKLRPGIYKFLHLLQRVGSGSGMMRERTDCIALEPPILKATPHTRHQVGWLRDRVNTNMPSLGMRGPKPTPFDTDEIAAIFRMLVGYINIHDVTFKQYLRAADRLGNFVRQVKSVTVSEERWNKFMMCLAFDAASVHELFERVSEGLSLGDRRMIPERHDIV
jgi:hypothetical protein